MVLYFITFDKNASTFRKSMDTDAQLRIHIHNMLAKDFYLIASSDLSTINCLINKQENAYCHKYGLWK